MTWRGEKGKNTFPSSVLCSYEEAQGQKPSLQGSAQCLPHLEFIYLLFAKILSDSGPCEGNSYAPCGGGDNSTSTSPHTQCHTILLHVRQVLV